MRDFSPSLCLASVNVACVRRNLRMLATRAALPAHRCMPVVKADAYGHGLVPVARALALEGVGYFAVNGIDEGVALRQADITQDIVLLLGIQTHDNIACAAHHDCIVVAHSYDSLARLLVQPTALRPRFAIKYDTGMTRLGLTPEDTPAILELLRQAKARPTLVLSHLALADSPQGQGYTHAQAATFASLCTTLRALYPDILTSLCNSAGALAYPEYMGDIARPGEALYGGNVFDGTDWTEKGAGFTQALAFSAPVLQVRDVAAGQPVSYGGLYAPAQPSRLAVLGMGYANGYPRYLSERGGAERGEVCLAGHRAPVRGRVCMSMTLVDVTHIPHVQEGDRAWITGGPDPEAIDINELARQWDTIPYEVHCVLGRNTRQYV